MKNNEIIKTIQDAIELIEDKIEGQADRWYSRYLLGSTHSNYVQAYKDGGNCERDQETITNLQQIIDQLESE